MFLEDGIVVPGQAAKSVLVKKITEPDPKDRMPPPDSGHALTETQIGLLKRWIDEGARWDTHWAYAAPSATEPPAPHGRTGPARRSTASSWRASSAKACGRRPKRTRPRCSAASATT